MKTRKISIKNIVGVLSAFACIFWISIGVFLMTKKLGLTPFIIILIAAITFLYLYKTKFYSANQVKTNGLLFYKSMIIAGSLFFMWFIVTLLEARELRDSDGQMILFGMISSMLMPIWYMFINECKRK